MIRAVALVGFKKTGKTTLLIELARELRARGRTVAAVKYTHSGLDLDGTDTAKFTRECVSVAGVGPGHSSIYWNEAKGLQDLLPLLQAEIVLVEGGKQLTWLPRILVLAGKEPEEILDNGLSLASWGDAAVSNVRRALSIAELATLVEEQGFVLPGLDCEGCGRPSCLDLGRDIVAGSANTGMCLALHAKLSIFVGGEKLPLNPFVDRLVAATIRGLLTELKGNVPGKRVEIIVE